VTGRKPMGLGGRDGRIGQAGSGWMDGAQGDRVEWMGLRALEWAEWGVEGRFGQNRGNPYEK